MAKRLSATSFECYARALGNCDGPMSREHYVTEGGLEIIQAALPGGPRVYENRKGDRRLREIGKLAERILCKKHNSGLSEFDKTFIEMMHASESMYEADQLGDPSMGIFVIRGDYLERWMLKTLIGGLYSGKLWNGLDSMKGREPPREWLEILYRGREFPPGHGLYWLPSEAVGLSPDDRDEFETFPWLSGQPPDHQAVIGLHVSIFGFHLDLRVVNPEPGSVSGKYRPAGLRIIGCGKKITFDWKGGPRYPEIALVR